MEGKPGTGSENGYKSLEFNKVSVLSTLQEIVKLAATANSLAEFKQSLARIQ